MVQYQTPRIEDYEPLIGEETVERIRGKARKLKGLRVVNFNSTFHGGSHVSGQSAHAKTNAGSI